MPTISDMILPFYKYLQGNKYNQYPIQFPSYVMSDVTSNPNVWCYIKSHHGHEWKGGDKTLAFMGPELVVVNGSSITATVQTKGLFMSPVLSRLLFYQGRPTNDVSSRGIQCELCASQRLFGRLLPGEIQQLDTEGIEWDFSWSLGFSLLQYSLLMPKTNKPSLPWRSSHHFSFHVC